MGFTPGTGLLSRSMQHDISCTAAGADRIVRVKKASLLSQKWTRFPHEISYLWLVTGPVCQQAAYRLVRLTVRHSSRVLST